MTIATGTKNFCPNFVKWYMLWPPAKEINISTVTCGNLWLC